MLSHKKSFVLYKDLINDIELLSDSDAGVLFFAVLNYVNGNPVDIDENLIKLYSKIISDIEYEWGKYNSKTGKFHWNYKGGITPENKAVRNSDKSKYWRVKVFERDNYTCQKCGNTGGILNAHHIKEFSKYKELRFDVNNGMTLCKSCHIKIHSKNG